MDSRRLLLVGASAAFAAAAFGQLALAKGFRRNPQILRVETPLGRQGTSGGGANVVLPFVVADITGKPVDVEVQFVVDRNADGMITDDEYQLATEDRLDPRNSRANTVPQLFATGSVDLGTGDPEPTGSVSGASHGYVWKTLSDVGRSRLAMIEYALTPQGRLIPDPDNPGAFLFATGPDGVPFFAGVKVRMRTVVPRKRHRRTIYGAWAYTDSFTVDNSIPPSMKIDSIEPRSPLRVHWTAYDSDSEDLNGNGVLDVADGEDMNGNGKLDCEHIGVAFDFHLVGDGEDPASMTDAQLESLAWSPCTRVAGVGDTDSLDARPGVSTPESGDQAGVCSAPPGVGRQWVFAWDPVADVGTTTRGFILRATPFDQTRSRGKTFYSRTIVYEAP